MLTGKILGPKVPPMEFFDHTHFYRTVDTFRIGVAWGTCPILKFRDPLNISASDEATRFKFGVHVDPGLFLPADQKLPPSGRGLGYVPNFEISGPPQYLCIG